MFLQTFLIKQDCIDYCNREGIKMNTILIVDAEPRLVKLVKLYLEPYGFYTVSVQSGEEALKYLSANSVQMVIMDAMLQRMDGRKEVREIRKKYNIPILIVTARDGNMEILKSFESGANGHIVLPIEKRTLLWHVHTLLGKQFITKGVVYC